MEYYKKIKKSELVHETEKELRGMSNQARQNSPYIICTVFDFMLHARTIAAIAASSMKHFGEFLVMFLNRILYLSTDAERADVVFDIHHENSIKAGERHRCMKKDQVNMTVSSSMTTLPKDMDAFCASIQNKSQLLTFFRGNLLHHKGRLSRKTV